MSMGDQPPDVMEARVQDSIAYWTAMADEAARRVREVALEQWAIRLEGEGEGGRIALEDDSGSSAGVYRGG